MSLTQRFRTVLAIQIALGAGVAILLTALVLNQRDLRRSLDAHHQASLLADELRQSSDDLTRMARSYVVTGDARFESDYRAILDIRNGKRPRPVDYHRVYWDLVLPDRPAPRPAGEAISMKELLARQGLTAVEREMLTRAQDNSDALARIEEIALHAVKGQFADSTGAFTVHGAPDHALAMRLMNDATYFERKAAIMAPIDTFYVLFERRTAGHVSADGRRAMMLLQALGVLLLTISGAFMYSFLSLRRQIAARERSERELATTAALLERAGAVARVGGWELDLRTMAHFWSAETCRILEVDPPVAPPLDQGINFYVPDDRPVISAAVQAAIDDGTPYDVELSALTAKGRRIHVRAQGVAVRENGRTVKLQGAIQDITERREAEAALHASEARLEQAFGASPIGMGLVSMQGRYLKANRALCAMLGWSESEMLAMDFQSVTHPDDVATSLALSREMLDASRPTYEIEKRYRRKDGGEILAQLNVSLVRDAAGMPVLFVAQVQDITARKQAVYNLSESEERFRSLVANAPYCIHEIDLAGRLTAMNAAGLSMMGVDNESAIQGVPYLDAVGDRDRERVAGLLTGALAGQSAEFVFQSSNGMEFQSSFVPIADDSGRVRRLMGVTIDITAQKQEEAVDAFLAQAGMSAGGEPFFLALARFLAESLRTDYVCIDRLDDDALNATTLAVWHDGRFDDNLTYALSDTPCAEVVGQKVCCYPANVSRLFPNDVALQELRAESYVGVTLWSHSGQPIGLIAVIGRQALTNGARAESTLARVALRAAGELERLLIEDELRASEAHARAVIDASPVPMALNNEAAVITYVNPAFVRTFGYAREDIPTLADWWTKAYPDATYRQQVADAWHAELARSVRTGTAFEPQDLEVRCKDGTERFVVVHATSLSQGAARNDLVVFHDITERRRVEAAHRLEGAALQAVANAVMITDRAGVIVWTNSAFTTSTGYTSGEAVGRMPGALLKSGEQDAAFYRTLWDTILAGDVWRGELVNKRKDGSRYLEEMTITPLVDPSGTITHFIGIKQDVTQRKTLESQLQQAQKMESVGLLAGGVAHDFNNMLGVILGTVEIAMEQVDPAQPLYDDLLEIRKATVRSADLTRQLLAFARRQTIAPTVLDLNETVPGLLSMLQRLIGEDISLLWQPATALWPVLMDRSQMDQILTNLCVNARHAIAGIGTVRIATANAVADAAFCAQHAEAVSGEYVQLSVRDTGSGMDAATQARIFEPFFSTKDLGAGIGLGLATVYGAIKQNQGFVTVASTLGAGTTFDIYLPRHEGSATPARQTGAVAADLRGSETILVVEDEPAVSRLVTKALDAQGYLVLTANSAAEALRLATAHAGEIHLLLSDVVMPEMNGRDLAHALLKLRPTLRPLFMSGHTADVIAIRGLLAPGVAFIEKPFTPVALAAKVREVLDSA